LIKYILKQFFLTIIHLGRNLTKEFATSVICSRQNKNVHAIEKSKTKAHIICEGIIKNIKIKYCGSSIQIRYLIKSKMLLFVRYYSCMAIFIYM